MKIAFASVLAVFGLICDGLVIAAEPPKSPAPTVIRVADIVREFEFVTVHKFEFVTVHPQEMQEDGQLKQDAFICFFFKSMSKAEVDSLFKEALDDQRLIQVMDGTNLVAICRIAGTSRLQKSEKEVLYGLNLGFGSVEDAERAAIAMREDMDTAMRRVSEDRKSWRL